MARRAPGDRRARLRQALSADDPLAAIEGLIDDTTAAGQVFRHAFACLLETHSAGLPILFDRFEEDDLRRVEAALAAIEATRTLADYRTLKAAFDAAVASGMDPLDASEAIAEKPELKRIGRGHKMHVAELERQLLAFGQAHVEQL